MDSTTGEDVRGLRARGSRVDYDLYGAVDVRLVDRNGSVRLQAGCVLCG